MFLLSLKICLNFLLHFKREAALLAVNSFKLFIGIRPCDNFQISEKYIPKEIENCQLSYWENIIKLDKATLIFLYCI